MNLRTGVSRKSTPNFPKDEHFLPFDAHTYVNLKTGVSREQSLPNFPKNEHFLHPDTHTFVCVSGGKKCSFFGKFGVLCFLETPVLRFALLPYYRRFAILTFHSGENFCRY